ncbi:hypothetical protein TNCV_3653081 [Trichonephila clavipes]|nr:hypothetical protein TNCV_3653081 [Trichonephila clavipes]
MRPVGPQAEYRGARMFTPVVALALSTMQLTVRFCSATPQFKRQKTLRVARDLPPIFPFHPPHERNYTFTTIDVFSGIRTQSLRRRCQRH